MINKFDSVKFNLTGEMAEILIKFIELKKRLKNSSSKQEKDDIENELNKYRKQFIKAFKTNNKKEIIEYLKIKNQK